MKKYTHELSSQLTPKNWQEKLNLKALSLDELVSIFGDMKKQEGFSKKLAGYLREIILARMPEGEDEYDGTFWELERSFAPRIGDLDIDRITEEMGEQWVENHRKDSTEVTTLRSKRKDV